MTAFIERTLTAIASDGTHHALVIRLDAPRPHEQDWACGVFITGFMDPMRDVYGVDSWQALQLAQNLTLSLLNAFVDRGGRLLFYDAPITPAKLFTSVEPKPSTRI